MVTAYRGVHDKAGRLGVNNRVVAMIVAIRRVEEAMKLRGWV
jgi:glutamate dehydrogenase (NAD(P)+)